MPGPRGPAVGEQAAGVLRAARARTPREGAGAPSRVCCGAKCPAAALRAQAGTRAGTARDCVVTRGRSSSFVKAK